jgi:tetratricopeptide (TPR) repeat protein
MFAFYLQQIFAPFSVAVNYPMTPVTQIGATNFIIPLAVSAAAVAGIMYLAKTSPKTRLASAIFLLPLIPAMNATVFISEQIVHDRYLYLPLLGALMLLVPLAAKVVNERYILTAGCIIAAALSFQTYRYNTAWANNMTLWTWTSAVDDSSFTSMQLGSALAEAGRNDESIAAYTAAIKKKPSLRGYLGRARNYNTAKQYAYAEKDLLAALGMPKEDQESYALYQTYESLGIAYLEQKKFALAIRNFTNARDDLPIYKAALTEKLAVVLYQAGQKADALQELESVRDQAERELLPESKSVFLRLGMLYSELGRKDDARSALNDYLRLTAAINDKNTLASRSQAAKLLETLK